MKHYYPEDIKMVNFYGRLIPTVDYPDSNDKAVVVDDIIVQLGLGSWKEELMQRAVYDTKFLAQIIMIDDGPGQQLVVIPLHKLNAFLYSIRISKDDELWFTQEVIDASTGEIKEETVSLRENLIRYQDECSMALHSYWTNGIAINPNVDSPFAALGSLWRTARMNRNTVVERFAEYAESTGEDFPVKVVQAGISVLLKEFLPAELVDEPESYRNGYDLYRLAVAEDFISRYLNNCIVEHDSPTHCFTQLDADMIVAFHKIASGLLEAVDNWNNPR